MKMRPWLTVIFALSTVACLDPSTVEHERMMDRIEHLVRLPAGSLPLDRYARHYALRPDGIVEALYVVPDGMAGATSVAADQRVWLDRWKDLPAINDGECTVVSVEFDPRSTSVRAFCNGQA